MKTRTFAWAFGAGVAGFVALDRYALLPMYDRGHGQALIAYANGLAHLLMVPVLFPAGGRLPDGGGGALMLIAAIVPLYALVGAVLHWTRKRRPRSPRAEGEGVLDPSATGPAHSGSGETHETAPLREGFADTGRLTRRGVLKTAALAGARVVTAGVVAGVAYTLLWEPRWFESNRHVVEIDGLPAALEGLRVVQLTDVHHGPWVPLGYIRRAVAAANALGPDVVVLTGDYVSKSWRYIDPVAEALGALRPKIASFGVLGNHDWWEGAERMRTALERGGVRMIDNTRVVLGADRSVATSAAQGLCIAGVGDLWEDRQDYAAALGGLPEEMPRLLLSHNPDSAEEGAMRSQGLRVDLMLSGHTHGGQVRVPRRGTPVLPSRYGQKYASGFVEGRECRVFVSKGLGMAVLPLRFQVRPEIVLLELRRKTAEGA